MKSEEEIECQRCGGSGTIKTRAEFQSDFRKCPDCHGRKATMKSEEEIKFRACIDSNTIIHFTLKELVCCDDRMATNGFSMRLVKNWIREGSQPDRFIGLSDREGENIYEHDILKVEELIAVVIYSNKFAQWEGKEIGGGTAGIFCINEIAKIIGNTHLNSELLNS